MNCYSRQAHFQEVLGRIPTLEPRQCEELDKLFLLVDQAFQSEASRQRHSDRRNFLSYDYTAAKLAKLLGFQIPQPRRPLSSIKLTRHDDMWRDICKAAGWPEQGLLFEVRAAKCIQAHWRGLEARRQLQRLKICREIEYYPGVGVEYLRALEDWKQVLDDWERANLIQNYFPNKS